MAGKVLHILSQRPDRTGSGITLDALVREAAGAGWEQAVIAGLPAGEEIPAVGGLAPERVFPVRFEGGALEFPIPGMSDVMPYRSTRWSSMTAGMLDRYREAWRDRVGDVIRRERPDLIHAHHIWLMSSLLPGLARGRPIVLQCHATGLRQMVLCPHLAGEVSAGCARADRFLVLHEEHASKLASSLGAGREAIDVIGSGYRADLFHGQGRRPAAGRELLYVGKYSAAKGLPQLLDAMDALPETVLHVAGTGSGDEAERIRRRMEAMPAVVLHGQVDQGGLAALMRECDVCVLPSFYEGVPLVLVEAAACGCRLVSTDLPGVREVLAPVLGKSLTLVEPPAMRGIDTPHPGALPAFVERFARGIESALADRRPSPDTSPFTWTAVFRKVETVWRLLLDHPPAGRQNP